MHLHGSLRFDKINFLNSNKDYSSLFNYYFKALHEQLNYTTRTVLYAEVETRFSYIYRMIDSICSNTQALIFLGQSKPILAGKVPSKEEFLILEVIVFVQG